MWVLKVSSRSNVQLKGAVSPHSSSFLLYFANYSPSMAMELKVGKEITWK